MCTKHSLFLHSNNNISWPSFYVNNTENYLILFEDYIIFRLLTLYSTNFLWVDILVIEHFCSYK